ncbi:MAG: GTP cyclohydrolase FolE2 [Pseudomonadota bacterium]
MDLNQKKVMPDVAESQKSSFSSPLKWVGMEKVAVPLKLGNGIRVPAQADIFVNVSKEEAKGIHMSRLYLCLKEELNGSALSFGGVEKILKGFVSSQKGLSTASKLVLRWEEMSERSALLSEYSGWKAYPVEINADWVEGDQLDLELKFSVFYSSACPCSAALSRQLYQQAFSKEFCDDTMTFEKVFQWLGESQIATPHSQRSRADITVKMKSGVSDLSPIRFIDEVEAQLKTPVQTAVKREDEQEFARLNGENTMFVEDALRTMKKALKSFDDIESFEVKTHHFESLHDHDAVGVIQSE